MYKVSIKRVTFRKVGDRSKTLEGAVAVAKKKSNDKLPVDKMIKKFTYEGNKKLENQYEGTKQAIVHVAREKMRKFMGTADVGLGQEEREMLVLIIAGSMMQSFSLGYGLGKVEGIVDRDIYL